MIATTLLVWNCLVRVPVNSAKCRLVSESARHWCSAGRPCRKYGYISTKIQTSVWRLRRYHDGNAKHFELLILRRVVWVHMRTLKHQENPELKRHKLSGARYARYGRHPVRHDGGMHLTPDELTLGVGAIAAVAGWGGAVVTSRAGRRQAHLSRLWERRADVYEFVLSHADAWRSSRAETIRRIGSGELDAVVPEPVAAGGEWHRARARLEMYGERQVREAFERFGQADGRWVSAVIGWHAAAATSAKADRGKALADKALADKAGEGADLVRLRKAVDAARDAADEEQEKLVEVVAKAVGRLPRFERRAWRRPRKLTAD
jgi:hypothetical protein